MTSGVSAEQVARNLTEGLRATAQERQRIGRPALVEDAAGGDPILYDDEPEGAPSNVVQQQRPQRGG